MTLTVWEVFLALFGDDEERGDESDGEDDEGRFVPSPLDLSIRIGHGGSDGQRVRALSRVNDRARELENERRDS